MKSLKETYKQVSEAKSYKDAKTAIKDTIKKMTPYVIANGAFSKDDQFGVEVDVISDYTGNNQLALIFTVIVDGKVDRIDTVTHLNDDFKYAMKNAKTTSDIAENYYYMIK